MERFGNNTERFGNNMKQICGKVFIAYIQRCKRCP
jgi:hypothetical protein